VIIGPNHCVSTVTLLAVSMRPVAKSLWPCLLLQEDDDDGSIHNQKNEKSNHGGEDCNLNEEYVPSGDEPVHNSSSVTKGQLFTLIFAFILRHCCTELALRDLIALFNTVIPGCMPHNVYYFKKLLNSHISEKIETHIYCSNCGDYLCVDSGTCEQQKCNNCSFVAQSKDLVNQGYFFKIFPLSEQLSDLFSKREIQYVVEHMDAMEHNTEGTGYAEARAGLKFPELITLTCNTDGVPVFSSSNASLWPVFFVINELPLTLRHANMMLCALWFGSGKPRLDVLFRPIVHSLQHLYDQGFSWVINGKQLITKVVLSVVSCDSVARPCLQNLKQFNGEYGCSFCLHAGKVTAKGKGFVRSYVHQHVDDRTNETMLQYAEEALQLNVPVKGVKGPSILSLVPKFNLVTGFVPEYMHSVLLGAVRQFVFLWCDSASHKKPYYLGTKIDHLDNIILKCKPPSEIKRLPRSLKLRKYWKASEWRNFLLFYYVCLKDNLQKPFFDHWCLLSFSIYNLMQTQISNDTLLQCELALCKFVCQVESLYGEQHVTFNVHLLTHLTASVARWGPLWATSAFLFEDANGKLLTFFHGTRGLVGQIFRSFMGVSCLHTLANRYNCMPMSLFNSFTNVCFGNNASRLTSDLVALGHSVKRALSLTESDALLHYMSLRSPDIHLCSNDVTEYKRLILNGRLICTDSYCQPFKRNDSLVEATSGVYVVTHFIVAELCDQGVNCNEHHSVIEFLFLCKPVNLSCVQRVDKDISCNIMSHVKSFSVLDQCIVLRTAEFVRKLISVADNKGNDFCIIVPQLELD